MYGSQFAFGKKSGLDKSKDLSNNGSAINSKLNQISSNVSQSVPLESFKNSDIRNTVSQYQNNGKELIGEQLDKYDNPARNMGVSNQFNNLKAKGSQLNSNLDSIEEIKGNIEQNQENTIKDFDKSAIQNSKYNPIKPIDILSRGSVQNEMNVNLEQPKMNQSQFNKFDNQDLKSMSKMHIQDGLSKEFSRLGANGKDNAKEIAGEENYDTSPRNSEENQPVAQPKFQEKIENNLPQSYRPRTFEEEFQLQSQRSSNIGQQKQILDARSLSEEEISQRIKLQMNFLNGNENGYRDNFINQLNSNNNTNTTSMNNNNYGGQQLQGTKSNYASNSQALTDFATIARQNKGGPASIGQDNNSSRIQAYQNAIISNNDAKEIIVTPSLIRYQETVHKKGSVSDEAVIILGWVMLIVIGLWTFVMMVSDVIGFTSIKFIQVNDMNTILSWYSSNSELQTTAGVLVGGMGQNYITLLDFLVYFFISKGFSNLWLSDDYWENSVWKQNIVFYLFIKDILVIIFSLTASDYSMGSGWTAFGVFWLSTFAKMSILISLVRIFYFRLGFFKEFGSEADGGVKAVLKRWGILLFDKASANGTRSADVYLVGIILILYLPLVLHCIIGMIEATYVLIIWIAVLIFLVMLFYAIGQICEVKEKGKPYSLISVVMRKQKDQYASMTQQPAVLFLLLVVLIPGIASASFTAKFHQAMAYHFTGQQLTLQFFSLPYSTYVSKMTFICNLLSLI